MAEFRRHWIALFAESFPLFILAILPLIIWPGIILSLDAAYLDKIEPLMFFLTSAWLLFIWVVFFTFWTNYYLDVLVITDKRVVDIEQYSFFSREVSECRLERIQDISVEVHGVLATALRFGNLHIQTAGETIEFIIKNVPNPYHAKDILAKLHDSALTKNREAVEDPD